MSESPLLHRLLLSVRLPLWQALSNFWETYLMRALVRKGQRRWLAGGRGSVISRRMT
jgi:hypothetical protein